MDISKIISNQVNTYQNAPKTAVQNSQKTDSTTAADNVDKFDPNSATFNKNYTKQTGKSEDVAIQGYRASVRQMKNEALKDYVNQTIGKQVGGKNTFPFGTINYSPAPFALDAFNAAEKTSEKYDDYWGVDAVAERIFTFAKTLAGDNDELFDTMKNAFLKGFKLAEGAKGGRLPDISYKTKSKVLELFDGWEKEIKAKKDGTSVTENKTEDKKTSSSSKTAIPYLGAAKYGASAQPGFDVNSFGKGGDGKVAFAGDARFGNSIKEDFDVNGYKPPQDK